MRIWGNKSVRNGIKRQFALYGKILVSLAALYFLFMMVPTAVFMQEHGHYLADGGDTVGDTGEKSLQTEKTAQNSGANKNTSENSRDSQISQGNPISNPSKSSGKSGEKPAGDNKSANGDKTTGGDKSDKTENGNKPADSKSEKPRSTDTQKTSKTQRTTSEQTSSKSGTSTQQGKNVSDVKPGASGPTPKPSNGNKPTTQPSNQKESTTSGNSGLPAVTPLPSPSQKPDIKKHEKVAYLTFDDGPSPTITPKILDILSRYEIKATFFVLGELAQSYPHLIKRIRKEGHFIGNHTYSHRYNVIYSSVDTFMNEIKKTDNTLASILGDDFIPGLIRFPGGSFGDRLKPFRDAVKQAGYRYIDWNALNGDSEALNVPVQKLYENIVNTTVGKKEVVILMHDAPGKETTVEALPGILDYLKAQGYVFESLEHFRYINLLVME